MKIKQIIRNFVNKIFGRKIPIYISQNKSSFLSGKFALVFGGTGGIGNSIVDKLVKNGCTVIVCTKDKNKLIENDERKNANLHFFYFDLNSFNEYDKNFKIIFEKFPKINYLLLSAGVHIENPKFNSVSLTDFDRVLNINLKSVYFCCQFVSNFWITNKMPGKILIISSSRGFEPAWSPYGIAKVGLNGFVKGLAMQLVEKNIIVNAISPGVTATKLLNYEAGQSINTDQNMLHRLILPEEVAELALFLLSDYSKSIVGENILISGGRGSFDIR